MSRTSLLLDAHALSSLAHNDQAIQAWVAVVAAQQAVMYVSAATLAEVVDGSARDAAVHQSLFESATEVT